MWGRFVSRDPVGFLSDGVNLYVYVSNKPVMAVDPSGLQVGRDNIRPKLPYWPENDDCKKACALASERIASGQWNEGGNSGIVVCYNGIMCACRVPAQGHPAPGVCWPYDYCVITHEVLHFKEYEPCLNLTGFYRAKPPDGYDNPDRWNYAFECSKRRDSLKCLENILYFINLGFFAECEPYVTDLERIISNFEKFLKWCAEQKKLRC
jgi:hypothetical protein